MSLRRERWLLAIMWLLPTVVELVVYFIIGISTIAISSQDFLKNWLYVPDDFQLIHALLTSADSLAPKILGERVGGSISLALFWGFTGVLFYMIVWVGSNFSTELNNDLIISKYVHPHHAEAPSPIRELALKTLFRTVMFVLIIIYTNAALRVLLPAWTRSFRSVITEWPNHQLYQLAITAFIGELITLHIFVVLIRLLLLRKRVFDY